jgi:RNA polymerase sigma factor (sigma-70 family)
LPFPATHLSLLRRIRSDDADTRSRARDALASVYWAPLYTHVRLNHGVEPADAEDLTQGFFADALRRDLFARYDPARARFRTYLRACIDSYVANTFEAERRRKRGGGTAILSLDAAEVEGRLTSDAGGDPDAVFHREWVRSVLAAALARLRRRYGESGRSIRLTLFERYDVADADGRARPTYPALAKEYGIPETQVTNWLAAARRDFRSAVLETLRDLSGSDEELRRDTLELLGIES